jgi:outer membrane protein assembly factor BamB
MPLSQVVYVGIKGTVIALDRETGEERWRTDLYTKMFVHIVLDGDRIFASTKGEVFCLNAASGEILWRNELKGMGISVTSLAVAGANPASMLSLLAQKDEEEQASAT